METKVRTHENVIDKVCSILPVSRIVIESASFDIQKIRDPGIEGEEYQQGEQLGYENVKAYVKRKDGGSDSPDNLVTLCHGCHRAWHEGKKDRVALSSDSGFKAASQMSTMRWLLLDRVRKAHPDIPVEQTYGYVTNHERNSLGLEKRHFIDARVISGNATATRY